MPIDSPLYLHCKHFAPPRLHHRRYQEICDFFSNTFSGIQGQLAWYFHTYMGSHEDWKNLKTASRAGTTWPCEFRNWPFGFLSPAPEDAEINSKLCQDCSGCFETFDQPMSFIPSVFKTNIFLHFTELVQDISSINIFQIFIHIFT